MIGSQITGRLVGKITEMYLLDMELIISVIASLVLLAMTVLETHKVGFIWGKIEMTAIGLDEP